MCNTTPMLVARLTLTATKWAESKLSHKELVASWQTLLFRGTKNLSPRVTDLLLNCIHMIKFWQVKSLIFI